MSKIYYQARHTLTRGCLSFDYWRPEWTRRSVKNHY